MDKPLISVIIPVYNVEEYLDECIQSIVNQTYQNLEIILIDDGSTDNSPQMCDAWKAQDSRIKVIHKTNGGVSATRNAGLDIATGEYIGFVDSDDYIAPTMYEELQKVLRGSLVKVSCCALTHVTSDGKCTKTTCVPSLAQLNTEEAVNAVFYGQVDTAMYTKLYHREVFKTISFPEGETNEEYSLWIPILTKSKGLICVDKPLYYYRGRPGSITTYASLRESTAGLVYKNLTTMREQLDAFDVHCNSAFRFFAASNAYSCSLKMEKNYPKLSANLKNEYYKYRRIMWRHGGSYLFNRHACLKDKVLYFLVLTKLLRPLYQVFYREHL